MCTTCSSVNSPIPSHNFISQRNAVQCDSTVALATSRVQPIQTDSLRSTVVFCTVTCRLYPLCIWSLAKLHVVSTNRETALATGSVLKFLCTERATQDANARLHQSLTQMRVRSCNGSDQCSCCGFITGTRWTCPNACNCVQKVCAIEQHSVSAIFCSGQVLRLTRLPLSHSGCTNFETPRV